ncbi:thyroid receptor-interacting protein 11-like [Lucilia cuprina]|uniref:thyroid receptor-interacting protein 11-like n=1 Tax=Lucilia cuprina TaxID=7375 RepID=UPI001F053585|nr:thyroid receptor-interacting protein 11-like [Lucilia cuprina]
MSKSSVYPLYAIESLTPLCQHQKIPQTIRTVFHQDKPIRLVEHMHLTKIGQCSCNLCEKRNKSFCECLWRENSDARTRRDLENYSFKWQSPVKSEEKGATFCNRFNNKEKFKTKPFNFMQKFRRNYRKSKQFWCKTKAVEAEDTFYWILKPKEKMFSSETDLNRKLQIKTLREEILKMIKEKELKLNEEQKKGMENEKKSNKSLDKEVVHKSLALAKSQNQQQVAYSKSSSIKSLDKQNEENLQVLLLPSESKRKIALKENKAQVDKSSLAKANSQSKNLKMGKLQTKLSFLKNPQSFVESKQPADNLQISQTTEQLLEQAEKGKSFSSSKTKNELQTNQNNLENVKKGTSFLCNTKVKAFKTTPLKSYKQRKSSLREIKSFTKKQPNSQRCACERLNKTKLASKTKSFLQKKFSGKKLDVKESCKEESKSSLGKIDDKNKDKADENKLKQTKSFAEKLSKDKQVNVKAKSSLETKINKQHKKVKLETKNLSKNDLKHNLKERSSLTKCEDILKLKSPQSKCNVNAIEEKCNNENLLQNKQNSRESLAKLNKSSVTKLHPPLEKSKTKSFSKSKMDIPLPQTNSVLIHYIRNITRAKAFKSSAKRKEIKTKTKLQAKSSTETNKTTPKIPISLQNVELNQSSFTEEQIKQEKRVHLKSLRKTIKSSLKQTKTLEEKQAKMKSLKEFNNSLNKSNRSGKTLSPITSLNTYNHLMQSVVQRYPKNMMPKTYKEEISRVYEENHQKTKASLDKPVTIVEFYTQMNAFSDLQLKSSDILKPESKLDKKSEEKSKKLQTNSLETQSMTSSPAKKPSLKLKQTTKFSTSSCYSKTLDKLTNLGKPKTRIQLNRIQFEFAKDPLKVLEDVGFQTLKTKRKKTKEKKL